MKTAIDFKECLKDSPKFRASLEEAENDVELLEVRLEKLVKQCHVMIDTGKAYSHASSSFVNTVQDLADYFRDDVLASKCLNKFAHAMSEMVKYLTILLDQAQRTVCKNLSSFIKKDIKKVKETKKHFEKISDDLDVALMRNATAQRSKVQECEEAKNVLVAMQSCFAHTSLDYVYHVNILHSNKRFDVLDTMLSFMHAQSTFYHQGHDLCEEFEPYRKDVAAQVEVLRAKAHGEKKEMEERHTLVQKQDPSTNYISGDKPDNGQDVYVEGYLFKRTTKAFKTWVRRWFTIQDNKLLYRKRCKDSITVMEEDLRLCTVKPVLEIDRRFCFDVVSPARSHMLQADTEKEYNIWISYIQDSVTRAYRETEHKMEDERNENKSDGDMERETEENNTQCSIPKQSKAQLRMTQLLSIPGNDHCCDCGSPDPRWASINLGITMCIACSGVHRSFGVHMSKVRSITLDAWEPEMVKVMAELGNDVNNRIYEANVDESVALRANPECKSSIREAWIKAKYVQKAFVTNLPELKTTAGRRLRGWSVKRKSRRSPGRTLSKDDSPSDPDSDVTSGLMEAVLSVSGGTSDSKEFTKNAKEKDTAENSLCETIASDVIVFGSEIEVPDFNKSLDLDSSEESSETEEETKSTTSWEDMSKLDPNMLLYKAAQARNLPVMLEALANGADPNWVNSDEEKKTPLMKAVETGSLSACEFLLLNGAKLDRKDKNCRTPLHHATILGHTGQVCQFLKRGADLNARDKDGQDPLTIAVNTANADIVTLLRLSKLNEEMKETDGYMGIPGDETFNDVFRDFTNMASNNPEKLKRNPNEMSTK
ncbi:hypothetical protein ScPMuIL_007643 [Solemya velum]